MLSGTRKKHTQVQFLKNSKEYQLTYCVSKLRSGFPSLGWGRWLKRAEVGTIREPKDSFEADSLFSAE